MDETIVQIRETIAKNCAKLNKEMVPGSAEAESLARYTNDLIKIYLDYMYEATKLEAEKKEKEVLKTSEKKAKRIDIAIRVGEALSKVGVAIMTSMFNAAVFQKLMLFEENSTIGSTSTRTFLRGGLNIFKSSQM